MWSKQLNRTINYTGECHAMNQCFISDTLVPRERMSCDSSTNCSASDLSNLRQTSMSANHLPERKYSPYLCPLDKHIGLTEREWVHVFGRAKISQTMIDKPVCRLVAADGVYDIKKLGIWSKSPIVDGNRRRRHVGPFLQVASFDVLYASGTCTNPIRQTENRLVKTAPTMSARPLLQGVPRICDTIGGRSYRRGLWAVRETKP